MDQLYINNVIIIPQRRFQKVPLRTQKSPENSKVLRSSQKVAQYPNSPPRLGYNLLVPLLLVHATHLPNVAIVTCYATQHRDVRMQRL